MSLINAPKGTPASKPALNLPVVGVVCAKAEVMVKPKIVNESKIFFILKSIMVKLNKIEIELHLNGLT